LKIIQSNPYQIDHDTVTSFLGLLFKAARTGPQACYPAVSTPTASLLYRRATVSICLACVYSHGDYKASEIIFYTTRTPIIHPSNIYKEKKYTD